MVRPESSRTPHSLDSMREIHYIAGLLNVAGWSSPVARWAHNPKVAGSNPAPATNECDNAGDGISGVLYFSSAQSILEAIQCIKGNAPVCLHVPCMAESGVLGRGWKFSAMWIIIAIRFHRRCFYADSADDAR